MRIYEAFKEFYSLYIKEKNLNDIQEYNEKLIDEIKRFINSKKNFINSSFSSTNGTKKQRKLNLITDKGCYFELYTLRYYFSEYFRIRLSKIEVYVIKHQIITYTDQIKILKNLSVEEIEYYKDYINITNNCVMKTIKPDEEDKTLVEEICNNLSESNYDFVFVKAVTDLNNVEIKVDGNLQEVDIEKGDVLLCRLAAISEHINNGNLEMF